MRRCPSRIFVFRSSHFAFQSMTQPSEVTYGSYLALDELLQLQRPRTTHAGELWFKVILRGLGDLVPAMSSGNASLALWHLNRVNALMRIVSAQLSSLETLPPQHFAQFRGYLGSSSGSQSVQFRAIEAASGLRDEHFMKALEERGPLPESVQRALSRPTL